MKPKDRRKEGRGGLELAEEAVHLLRLNAGAVLAAYYIGSLPFILGLLYFWTDMSRSPYAAQHLTEASLGMALLFLWMKCWQAIFVNRLRALVSGRAATPWKLRRVLRVLLIQSVIQPSAVLVLPLAVLPAGVPLPWAYAFYQNVTALTEGDSAEILPVFRKAWRQMLLWPAQNHVALVILAGFGFCVLLNLVSVCYLLPQALKTLLGIESIYTQSPASFFNTTFVAAMFSLAYLCVDPIVKTVYLLRCFYGESLQTGEDLRAELRGFAISARSAMVGLILIFFLAGAGHLNADDAPPPIRTPAKAAAPPSVAAPKLDEAINDVIHQPKYTWRLPREKVAEENAEDGAFVRFIKSVIKATGRWLRDVMEWIGHFLEKWFRHAPSEQSPASSGNGWITQLQVLFFVLLAVVASALVILLIRAWQNRRRQSGIVQSEAMVPLPDLADENVAADQLPEDGWIKLGRELLGRGELRLALRAFYFASLSHLATRNLLTIAKFKSNREYERELGRRGHALPNVMALFGENVSVFDRSWYGLHDVNVEMVGRFLANVERIKET